ncbi:hypothetical protein tb265_22440 [Gemmatimonadetes bacterium T265]|nr:hypothetical protein tb265_22440 [Gemmatimonadetes bacterium T265]
MGLTDLVVPPDRAAPAQEPTRMPALSRVAVPVRRAALAAAVALAACGRGDNQAADRNGADTTSADRSTLGAPVGSMKPQMDSGIAAGKQTLDSLHKAGVGVKNGLDSVGSKVQATTANEPGHDTSHINNRATPGAGPAAPAGTPPGSKRP